MDYDPTDSWDHRPTPDDVPDDWPDWVAEQFQSGNLADESSQALADMGVPDPAEWTGLSVNIIGDYWSVDITTEGGRIFSVDVGSFPDEGPAWIWDLYDFGKIYVDTEVNYEERQTA